MIEENPNYHTYHLPYRAGRLDTFGWIEICLGNTEKGLKMLVQIDQCLMCKGCSKKGCEDQAAHLGDYYLAIKDYAKAKEYYELAVERNANSVTNKVKLENINALC